MARETFQAGIDFKAGDEVWVLTGLSMVYGQPARQQKGDRKVGKALEDVEQYGLVVVEVEP